MLNKFREELKQSEVLPDEQNGMSSQDDEDGEVEDAEKYYQKRLIQDVEEIEDLINQKFQYSKKSDQKKDSDPKETISFIKSSKTANKQKIEDLLAEVEGDDVEGGLSLLKRQKKK